jgi:hypothetical protein
MADRPDAAGLPKGPFTHQGSFDRKPTQSLGPSVPDEDRVARKHRQPDGGSELARSIAASTYAMKKPAGRIEHSNLGRNLLENREASVRQPGCRYGPSPLVLWCTRDDANPDARGVAEPDGRTTLQDTGREFMDHCPGRIPDHGLMNRASALAAPSEEAKCE